MTIEIANRLQQLRKQNNLSQEELATKIGVSRQAVSKWERAEASPDTDNLLLLAKLYNVSLDELLRTELSIMNLNTNFRNADVEKPVSMGISLKKDDYVNEVTPDKNFTDIEIYPQMNSTASVPQGSPFNEEPARPKNIAAETPKSQFTTAQEFTAETQSDRIQSNSAESSNGSPYSNTGSAYNNSSNNSADPFSQMGIDLGKMGKGIGKGLEMAGKELGKGLDKMGRELGKQIDNGVKSSVNSGNASQPNSNNYNYSYCYSTKSTAAKDTECCKESKHSHRHHDRNRVDKTPSSPAYAFPYPILVVIAFFAAGFMFNAWHPAWMLFLTIPLYYTGVASKEKKNPLIFCYPVLAVILFLTLGFVINAWSWAWMIFLTIPLYYTWAGTCKKFKEDKD